MCKNTTPHQRSVGSCIFIAKIIKNRTIDEDISKSHRRNQFAKHLRNLIINTLKKILL